MHVRTDTSALADCGWPALQCKGGQIAQAQRIQRPRIPPQHTNDLSRAPRMPLRCVAVAYSAAQNKGE